MVQIQQRLLIFALLAGPALAAQKFYPDDPLWREPAPLRVGEVRSRKFSDYYDFFLNTFTRPGEYQRPGRAIPAGAVNTLGEVPDSAWYTNRHGRRRMSLAELIRGPDDSPPPSQDGPWEIIGAKVEGITPGFRIRDARGAIYHVKFDPITNPEMATAADVIGSKFFHALGYNVPQNFIVRFQRERLRIAPEARVPDNRGDLRPMSGMDLAEILRKVHRSADGSYRAVASLHLAGRPLGPFRFHGLRRDDPNDVIRHEHRRDLRGLYVFCSWLAHDDSRSINTLDMLVEENGLRYVKHHLIDFGSILGSASDKPNSPRSGYRRLFAWKPSAVEFFTLGLAVPAFARAHFPDFPAVGRLEYEVYSPDHYMTEYRNPAFENRLPDDTFWAAKQVMAFTAEEIRAIVKTGQYSDPRAEDWIVKCLLERRNKIGRVYFERVLPLDNFRIEDGRLAFDALAPQPQLAIQWSALNNQTGDKTPLPGETSFRIPANGAAYLAAQIRGASPSKTVTVYLRQGSVVGIERGW